MYKDWLTAEKKYMLIHIYVRVYVYIFKCLTVPVKFSPVLEVFLDTQYTHYAPRPRKTYLCPTQMWADIQPASASATARANALSHYCQLLILRSKMSLHSKAISNVYLNRFSQWSGWMRKAILAPYQLNWNSTRRWGCTSWTGTRSSLYTVSFINKLAGPADVVLPEIAPPHSYDIDIPSGAPPTGSNCGFKPSINPLKYTHGV